MRQGIFKSFLVFGGSGYVQEADSLQEFYAQKKEIEKGIMEGDKIMFKIKETKQGLEAYNVKKRV